jgi:hypothetical protein
VIRTLIIKALTMTVTDHQRFLRECFCLSFFAAGTASFFLLAILNNFYLADFFTWFYRGPAVVLAAIMAHIASPVTMCWRCSMKRLMTATTKLQSLFTKPFPVELAMTLSSESASGCHLENAVSPGFVLVMIERLP